jgi:hypothetical protein
VDVRRFSSLGAADSRSLRFQTYTRIINVFVRGSTYVPFRRFLGDVRRDFIQRVSLALHGTLGSCLRDALHEGDAVVVACLLAPQTLVSLLPLHSPLVMAGSTAFFVINHII